MCCSTSGGTRERLRAGAPYIVVSLLSSLIFLVAIAMIYAATGTVNMADLSVKLAVLPDGIVAVLQALLLVAFGVKAAVFPMSLWLPDSYPSAPAPVTAVFAGLLTKVGIYAIIRVQNTAVPDRFLRHLADDRGPFDDGDRDSGGDLSIRDQADVVLHSDLAHRVHAVRRCSRVGDRLERGDLLRRAPHSGARQRCSWPLV